MQKLSACCKHFKKISDSRRYKLVGNVTKCFQHGISLSETFSTSQKLVVSVFLFILVRESPHIV